MINQLNINDQQIKSFLIKYDAWKQSPEEIKYMESYKEYDKDIRKKFLNKKNLNNISNNDLVTQIREYIRNLDGPVGIRLGEPRVSSNIEKIKRNLLYLIDSKDKPLIKVDKILEGKYSIKYFAKAFWTPIFSATYPKLLPNWNNKTENFFKKVGINITTNKLSLAEKYKVISDIFLYMKKIDPKQDFFSLNHLMHYGTVVPEGVRVLEGLINDNIINSPIIQNKIKDYLEIRLNKKSFLGKDQKEGEENWIWTESYKWRILPRVHKEIFGEEINKKNVLDKIEILKNNNPQSGSFVHWSDIDNLNKLAQQTPELVVDFFNRLNDESVEVSKKIDNFITEVKKEDETMRLGTPLFGYIFAVFDCNKYPIFKNSTYLYLRKLLNKDKEWKSFSLGEKYQKFTELCFKFGDYLNKNNYLTETEDAEGYKVKPGIIALDGQDFFYVISQVGNKKEKNNEMINEDNKKNNNTNMQKENEKIELPKNLILYGPPGTGKTFTARKKAKKFLEGQTREETEAERIEKIIKGLTWYEVIGVIMQVRGKEKYRVPNLINDIIAKVAAKLRNRTTKLGSTFHSQMKLHSDSNSETVKYAKRSGLDLFNKDVQGEWFLTEAGKEYFSSDEYVQVIKELSDIKTQQKDWKDFYKFITFHQSYSYEEFIEGIRPVLGEEEDGNLQYRLRPGVFKTMCQEAKEDPDNNYLLVIDEINRGNISKIFGELITLIEKDKRLGEENEIKITLPYSGEEFGVPSNLYIIGTMNTADRSIALLDIALRRRFKFKEIEPNLVKAKNNIDGLDLSKVLEKLNQKIEVMIDRDHRIGHSYFMKVNDKEELFRVWYDEIVPLLQEYFYNDWEKLEYLLGQYKDGVGFVEKKAETYIRSIFTEESADEFVDTYIAKIHEYSADKLIEALKVL